ncbi:ubiquitin family protein [Cardiosporidium cionae]|uniref:Ubiquitin family protein n=1 Tax=Cardiosporidium cionae TaxID=476202 RepID=A0ABQ7JD61_9APIC|nr:ubiquitin family protein [Cardiosporidium cionae]|eukprot:KAF8821930.1 ubiquitin family protein [Cardiosporidium cionae]
MGDESADMRPSSSTQNNSTSDDSVCSTQTEEAKVEQETPTTPLTGQSYCPATIIQPNPPIDDMSAINNENSLPSIVPQSPCDGIEADPISENNMILQIKLLTGATHSVASHANETVLSLKEKISLVTSVPPESQRLVAAGRLLEDSKSLDFYNIRGNRIIYVTRNIASTVNTSIPSGNANYSWQNPLSPPTNSPPVDQNAFGNAGFMDGILNSMMQNVVDNPDLLRMMFESNPMFSELRERNPELSHILDDPQMLRQCMELMRNPSLMREMTRSTDRAMSNIEAIPGGFNALRRMYHNIQEPMWNATIESTLAPGGNLATEISPAYNLGTDQPPTTEAMPNPWAPPRSRGDSLRPSTPATVPNLSSSDIPQLSQSRPRNWNSSARNVLNHAPPLSSSQVLDNRNAFPSPQNLNDGSALPSSTQRQNALPGLNQNMGRVLPGMNRVGPIHQLQQLLQNVNLGGIDTGNTSAGNSADSVESLEVQYRLQLTALRDMGFTDTQQCLRVLQQTGGNINRAIDQLLNDGASFHTT